MSREDVLEKAASLDWSSDQEVMELAREMHSLSREDILFVWAEIQKDTKKLFSIHPWVSHLMVSIAIRTDLPSWEESVEKEKQFQEDAQQVRLRLSILERKS